MHNGIDENLLYALNYSAQSWFDDESVLTLKLRRVQKMKFNMQGDFALCYLKRVMQKYSYYAIWIMMKWFYEEMISMRFINNYQWHLNV